MTREPGVHLAPLPECGVLRLTRNPNPFQSVQELLAVLDEIEAQLAAVDRSQFGLLVDTRAVPNRTEPEFERAFRHWRLRVSQGFPKIAVLVGTEAGRVRAEQLARKDGTPVRVFDDEADALNWVRMK